MAENATIDFGELLARQKLSRWHFATLTFCFLVLFIDGLDFNAINVAAPAILRAWHIERSAMGFVFGAGNFGILLGTILFGWTAIVSAVARAWFSAFSPTVSRRSRRRSPNRRRSWRSCASSRNAE